MNIETRYSRAAVLLVVLGVTSYATAAQTPIMALVAVPVVLVAWRLTSGPGTRAALPRWAVNLMVVAALLFAFYRATRQGLDVSGIAELVLLLQLIKLGDRRTPRDDSQILSLSVFLAIAAMLTSNDFWVGVQLIAFLPVLVMTVMLFQLRAGHEAFARAARGAAGPAAAPPVAAGRQLSGGLRAIAGLALMASLGIAALVFIFMPRGIGERFFGQWTAGPATRVTGFTDQVRLGTGGLISESQEVVMHVRVTTPEGESLGGDGTFQYFRGAVLERYDGGVWTARDTSSIRARQFSPVEPLLFGADDPLAVDVVQHVSLRAPDASGQALFTLWRPVRLDTRGGAQVVADPQTRAVRAYPREQPRTPLTEYSVASSTREPPATPSARTPGVSFRSPVVTGLASDIARAAGLDPDPATRPVADDAPLARAIESHLRTGFEYTLEEEAAPAGVDPIEHFLTRSRRGHCEYFAAAMTALCRAVGINARVAVGYLAAEYNAAADAYTVRASNAHAWVEAEIGVQRWRRFDPTPSAELVRLHRPALGLLGRARQWLDALEFLWNTRVVSFDERARARLLRADGSGEPGMLARFDGLLQRVRAGGPRLIGDAVGAGALVFLILAGAGSIVVAVLGRRAGAGARRLTGGARRKDPALAARLAQTGFYGRMLAVLSRRGVPKPSWRPPIDHAGTIGEAPVAAAVRSVAATYYRVRFGGASLTEAERREAEAAVARMAGAPRR